MNLLRLWQHAWSLHESVPDRVSVLKEGHTGPHPKPRSYFQLITTGKWKSSPCQQSFNEATNHSSGWLTNTNTVAVLEVVFWGSDRAFVLFCTFHICLFYTYHGFWFCSQRSSVLLYTCIFQATYLPHAFSLVPFFSVFFLSYYSLFVFVIT